jgi:crotonobetainyl-CoA:carnitine CoA-transferase CaiB-like acyl-CoA transferase
MTALPLAGHRVLELAHLIAGPVCGMSRADMGADVVKIEQPAAGDASRADPVPADAGWDPDSSAGAG